MLKTRAIGALAVARLLIAREISPEISLVTRELPRVGAATTVSPRGGLESERIDEELEIQTSKREESAKHLILAERHQLLELSARLVGCLQSSLLVVFFTLWKT